MFIQFERDAKMPAEPNLIPQRLLIRFYGNGADWLRAPAVTAYLCNGIHHAGHSGHNNIRNQNRIDLFSIHSVQG